VKTSGERFKYLANAFFEGNRSELARHLDIQPQSFSKYTGGDITPGGKILANLYELGVNTTWIVTGDGEIYNPDKLPPDKQWKRLFILRNRIIRFGGTQQKIANQLGVDLETYQKWEMGLEEIPETYIDRIYSMVERLVRKEWWYEGKGEMAYKTMTLPGPRFDYAEAFGSLEKKEGNTSPSLPTDDTHERIMECITEMVKRPKQYDRAVFGELLKMKLREIGVLPDEPENKNQ
jgi:transcriptional regulator with XRE-family HTH domain